MSSSPTKLTADPSQFHEQYTFRYLSNRLKYPKVQRSEQALCFKSNFKLERKLFLYHAIANKYLRNNPYRIFKLLYIVRAINLMSKLLFIKNINFFHVFSEKKTLINLCSSQKFLLTRGLLILLRKGLGRSTPATLPGPFNKHN